jgi:AcrR family transcriptional regulator
MNGAEITRRPPFGQHPGVGERGSDTQRRILAAALVVFGEVGFNNARVEMITSAADCSRPSFYQYFSSKDDLFSHLAGRLGVEMIRLIDQLEPVAADAVGVAVLADWIDDFLTLCIQYAPVFSAFHTASRHQEQLAQGSRSMGDRLDAALLNELLRARDAQLDSRVAGAIVSGVVGILSRCGTMSDRLLGRRSRRRLVHGLSLIIHRVFYGPLPGINILEPVRVRLPKPRVSVASIDRPVPDPGTRGARTRQRLLEAGAKVLPERGYYDSRVDDIVQSANLSHGSFYRHFESKDDLFRALAGEASTHMIDQLDGLPIGGTSESVRAWLKSWMETYRDNGGVISAWQEIQTADHEMQQMSDQVASAVLHRLVAMLRQRTFGDPMVDGLALLALLERMPYSVYTIEHLAETDAIEAMLIVIERGFLGKVTSQR